MLWLRLGLVGAIVIALAGAIYKITSFLGEKDRAVQERDAQIQVLTAKVDGMRLDIDRLRTSNASLEQDIQRRIEEAARATQEAKSLRAGDVVSSQRQAELERKLNDRDRLDKVDRLTHSRRAELVVQTVNRSAKCEIENFFQTDGQCRSGLWVPTVAKAASEPARGAAATQGASNASR